jgi:hypothetical protein
LTAEYIEVLNDRVLCLFHAIDLQSPISSWVTLTSRLKVHRRLHTAQPRQGHSITAMKLRLNFELQSIDELSFSSRSFSSSQYVFDIFSNNTDHTFTRNPKISSEDSLWHMIEFWATLIYW